MLVFAKMLTKAAMDHLVKVFKALADPTRVAIVNQLAHEVLCVGALAQRLGLTQSAISQHLRVLREAGLVEGNKRSRWVHYSLSQQSLRETTVQIIMWLGQLASEPAEPCASGSPCLANDRRAARSSKPRSRR